MGYFAGRAAPFGRGRARTGHGRILQLPSRPGRPGPARGVVGGRAGRRVGHPDACGGGGPAPDGPDGGGGGPRPWCRDCRPCSTGCPTPAGRCSPPPGRPASPTIRSRRCGTGARCLREHRGDGHVAALTAAGLDGCEALVLFAAVRGSARRTAAAVPGLVGGRVGLRPRPTRSGAGLVDGAGASPRPVASCAGGSRGRPTTWPPWSPVGVPGRDGRRAARPASSVAASVHAPGSSTYPNPMGLPAPADD